MSATTCCCGEPTIDLEGHLLRAHPERASRGLCPACGGVVAVGHVSDGAVVETHQVPAGLCRGSGLPPRRNTVLQ